MTIKRQLTPRELLVLEHNPNGTISLAFRLEGGAANRENVESIFRQARLQNRDIEVCAYRGVGTSK